MSFLWSSILHTALWTPCLQRQSQVARRRRKEMEFSNSNFQPIAQPVVHGILLFFTIKFKFPALLFFFPLGEAKWYHGGKKRGILLTASQLVLHLLDSVSPTSTWEEKYYCLASLVPELKIPICTFAMPHGTVYQMTGLRSKHNLLLPFPFLLVFLRKMWRDISQLIFWAYVQ